MGHQSNVGARRSLPVSLVLVLGIAGSGVSTSVTAQDAGSLLREQQRREELQRLDRLPAPDAVETPARSGIIGVERGQTLVIKSIRFTGKLDLLPEAERAKIADKAKGKRLGIIGIKGIADEVTIAIQQRGRLLGYAILPPQDITAGTVTIQLMEGRLSKIEFERKADVRIREEILNGLLHRSIVPDSVDKDTLEEALLRINDLPGVTARARLAPGESQQSSRLIIGVDQAPRVSGSLSGDNSGSYATGHAQATALINATDLTGYGDLTRLTGIVSEGQRFGRSRPACRSAPAHCRSMPITPISAIATAMNSAPRSASKALRITPALGSTIVWSARAISIGGCPAPSTGRSWPMTALSVACRTSARCRARLA